MEEKCLVEEARAKCKCKKCEQSKIAMSLYLDSYVRMTAWNLWSSGLFNMEKEK